MTGRRWVPFGTRTVWGIPAVGALVAHQRGVYRVREVREVPVVDWDAEDQRRWRVYGRGPCMVVVRPASVMGDDPSLRRHDRHLRARGRCEWDVYPDGHYPVCAACGEPMPCREQDATLDAQAAAESMGRFEIPGVCPVCQELVSGRQRSRTFEENVHVPLGPPVTFHVRVRCRDGLLAFEDVWVARDPDNRVSTRPAVCRGSVVVHVGAGTYECSEAGSCPGAGKQHRSWRACGCPEHPGGFSRDDLVGARNLAAPGRVE